MTRWFAWRPIIINGKWVWLVHVNRKLECEWNSKRYGDLVLICRWVYEEIK